MQNSLSGISGYIKTRNHCTNPMLYKIQKSVHAINQP